MSEKLIFIALLVIVVSCENYLDIVQEDKSENTPGVREGVAIGADLHIGHNSTVKVPSAKTLETSKTLNCKVVILGGSTAALAAALFAASNNLLTCLTEPTNWLGGQLTASGVPAVDYAWHTIDSTYEVGKIAKEAKNLPRTFVDFISSVSPDSTSLCWVSKNCFLPKLLVQEIGKKIKSLENKGYLKVLKNTVIKEAFVQGDQIEGIVVQQDTAKSSLGDYDIGEQSFSKHIQDLYTLDSSSSKKLIELKGSVFIDASEFGELLVLSGSSWVQGAEVLDGSSVVANPSCQQYFVYPIALQYSTNHNLPLSDISDSRFDLGKKESWSDAWKRVWSYRRLYSKGESIKEVYSGDVTVMNWETGNDFHDLPLFLEPGKVIEQSGDWKGGVSFAALEQAEAWAIRFAKWFRSKTGIGKHIGFRQDVFYAKHGISKAPYVRESRRSIGIDGFVLKVKHIVGATVNFHGYPFQDTVGIGLYAADIHMNKGCLSPQITSLYKIWHKNTVPFFIPLRALTVDKRRNLLVAGKTMAQSFLVNSATRTQPIEWSSGAAAGATATWMVKNNKQDSEEAFKKASEVRSLVSYENPVKWTLAKPRSQTQTAYPANFPNKSYTFHCPDGYSWEMGFQACVGGDKVIGNFTKKMISKCEATHGKSCSKGIKLKFNSKNRVFANWDVDTYIKVWGKDFCPPGTQWIGKESPFCHHIETQKFYNSMFIE